MEIRVSAFDAEAALKLIVEPWADEFAIPAGSSVRLVLDGDFREAMDVEWLADAVMVWPPRLSILRVYSASGEELRRFDSAEVPPIPGE